MSTQWQVFNADVIEWTKSYDGPLAHACLCDPPYHLVSIVKRFGKPGSAEAKDRDGVFRRASAGFMGQVWDGGDIAFQPDTWAALASLLYPGAFMIVYSGSRGWHRTACALEDAGLIMHPSIFGWLYGSGFPKATRIGVCNCAQRREGEILEERTDGSLRDVRQVDISKSVPPEADNGTILRTQVQRQGNVQEEPVASCVPQPQGTPTARGRKERPGELRLEGRGDIQATQGQLPIGPLRSVSAGLPSDGTEGRLRDGASPRDGQDAPAPVDADGGCSSQGPQSTEQHTEQSSTLSRQQEPQEGGRCPRCGKPIGHGHWVGHRYGLQALKPALEPILVFQKPYKGKAIDDITRTGAGAINVDGCRVGTPFEGIRPMRYLASKGAKGGRWANQEAPKMERPEGETAGNPLGRWPANFALVHLPECEYLGEEDDTYQINDFEDGAKPWGDGAGHPYQGREVKGTRPVWRCADECPVAALDRQTGTLVSGRYPGHRNHPKFKNTYGSFAMRDEEPRDYGSGGGSRFFYQASLGLDQADPVFYCGKVSPQERNAGLGAFPVTARGAADGAHVDNNLKGPTNALRPDKATKSANNHPTLKPIDLNRWLAKLLLPPAEYAPRRILIPFAGAGSEMIGAMLAEWDEIIGIEMMAEYANIARARLAHWAGASQMELFNGTS